jgi:hypothetical protein
MRGSHRRTHGSTPHLPNLRFVGHDTIPGGPAIVQVRRYHRLAGQKFDHGRGARGIPHHKVLTSRDRGAVHCDGPVVHGCGELAGTAAGRESPLAKEINREVGGPVRCVRVHCGDQLSGKEHTQQSRVQGVSGVDRTGADCCGHRSTIEEGGVANSKARPVDRPSVGRSSSPSCSSHR